MNTLGSKKRVEKPRPRNSNSPPLPVQYVWSCVSTYIPERKKINRDFTLSRICGNRNETLAGIHLEGKDRLMYRAWQSIGDYYMEQEGLTLASAAKWVTDWCKAYGIQLPGPLFNAPLYL